MKVTSPAGELDVVIRGAAVESGSVVVTAAVGSWEVKVYPGREDFKFFISVLFKPGVLILLLKRLVWESKEPPRM